MVRGRVGVGEYCEGSGSGQRLGEDGDSEGAFCDGAVDEVEGKIWVGRDGSGRECVNVLVQEGAL